MADHWWKQGDVLPEIFATLTDGNDVPVSVYGADVNFVMRNIETNEVVIDWPANNLDDNTEPNTGKVSYTPVLGDTDVPGGYFAEWRVTYNSGDEETFPDDGYRTVAILERLVEVSS